MPSRVRDSVFPLSTLIAQLFCTVILSIDMVVPSLVSKASVKISLENMFYQNIIQPSCFVLSFYIDGSSSLGTKYMVPQAIPASEKESSILLYNIVLAVEYVKSVSLMVSNNAFQ
jgi:hypothetical protein